MLPLSVLKNLKVVYRTMDEKSLKEALNYQKQILTNSSKEKVQFDDYNNPICQKIKLIEDELKVRKQSEVCQL